MEVQVGTKHCLAVKVESESEPVEVQAGTKALLGRESGSGYNR